MFAGHIGVALAASRWDRRSGLGLLALAALLPDALLWLFILWRREAVVITSEFPATHQPAFFFPYSHGLIATLAWAALAALLVLPRRRAADQVRASACVAALVCSHWLLDALVHRPELPVFGTLGHPIGFALWDRLPLALGLEAALVIGGLWLTLGARELSGWRRGALGGWAIALLGFTVAGMTVAPPPPSADAMAVGGLAMIAVACAGLWAIERGRAPGRESRA